VLGVASGLGYLPQPLLQALNDLNHLALGVVGTVQLTLLKDGGQDPGRSIPGSGNVINCA